MSNDFSTIAVALDGSEASLRALDFAIKLAKSTGGALELVTVLDVAHLDPDAGFHITEEKLGELRGRMSAEVFEPALARIPDTVVATTRELDGRAVQALLDHINGTRPSVAVFGRTGKGALQRFLEGSVSRAIVTHAEVPVVVVG